MKIKSLVYFFFLNKLFSVKISLSHFVVGNKKDLGDYLTLNAKNRKAYPIVQTIGIQSCSSLKNSFNPLILTNQY